jgi:hypothetical protein
MDKRKISIAKSADGKTTITRNKFGSSYKKESILLNTSTVIAPGDSTNEMMKSHNDGYDPIKLVNNIESIIMRFLKDKGLPTERFCEGTSRSEGGQGFKTIDLPSLLKHDHADIIGAIQASSCLFEIHCCKDDLSKGDYKAGMAHALRLVTAFQMFTFAIFESKVSLGGSRQDGLIAHKKMAKLTDEQCNSSFLKYETFTFTEDKSRKLKNNEKWNKVIKFIKSEFGIDISDRYLRDKYKVWKSR